MMYIMIMIRNMLKFKRSDLGRILRISHRDIIHLSRFQILHMLEIEMEV